MGVVGIEGVLTFPLIITDVFQIKIKSYYIYIKITPSGAVQINQTAMQGWTEHRADPALETWTTKQRCFTRSKTVFPLLNNSAPLPNQQLRFSLPHKNNSAPHSKILLPRPQKLCNPPPPPGH